MPETPRVGRWQYWLCGCTPAQNQNVMLPSEPECRACGTVRPETPAPMTVTGTVTAAIVNADGAQVVGKGRVAGVDDAPSVNAAILRGMYQNLLHMCAVSGEFRGDKMREFDELLAALRAAPAVGGEPVAWAIIGRDGVAWYVGKEPPSKKLQIITGERLAPLYAHPAPDGDVHDAARYRFLRDNPFQLRAIDGNAVWRGNVSAEDFDAHTDVAMANPAFAPTPSEDTTDGK